MAPNVARGCRAVIVTPAPRGSRAGNRKTAARYAGLLRQLGARVRIVERWQGEACELLLAVHAVKTAASVGEFAAATPSGRVVVVLAGTDVYPEFHPDAATTAALARADALILLQPNAGELLPPALRAKARTIVQSATAPANPPPKFPTFTACVLAHLRPVKAPLLPFEAVGRLPPQLRLELVVAGKALTPELEAEARAAAARDPRCRWLGELPRAQARHLLARSHVCIVPSAAEGGANVVSEAIAVGTPLLATAIPGNTGLLGSDWPALFAPNCPSQLAALLVRSAVDRPFLQALIDRTHALKPLVSPATEREALRRLLVDLRLCSANAAADGS